MSYHKGVQFQGLESRLQPGSLAAAADEAFQGRDRVIYLRDLNDELYATVHADLPELAFRGLPAMPATKVRHRKSGRIYTVENVEVATRLIRLREDVNANDGEPLRTRWYPVDDFDVMGLPANPIDARRELDAMKQRQAELEKLLADESAEKPAAEPHAKKAR